MMLGVLDPALFLPRPGEEQHLEAELDHVTRLCHEGRIELPALEEYWPDLWKQHGSTPREGRLSFSPVAWWAAT